MSLSLRRVVSPSLPKTFLTSSWSLWNTHSADATVAAASSRRSVSSHRFIPAAGGDGGDSRNVWSPDTTRTLRRHSLLDFHCRRTLTSSTVNDNQYQQPDSSLVDLRFAPSDYEQGSAVVYSNIISPEEAQSLLEGLSSKFKRRRYEKGHWDAVIIKYKEIELVEENEFLSAETLSIIQRIRHHLAATHLADKVKSESLTWLPCHAIDLHQEGELNAHVDSVRYSGDIVAGLSLESPSIMRLCPAAPGEIAGGDKGGGDSSDMRMQRMDKIQKDKGHVDLYLPPLSLYVLSGTSRYKYAHELLPTGSTFWISSSSGPNGEEVTVDRGRRLSVIFRDAKDEQAPH